MRLVTQYSCICQLFVDGGYAAENAGHSYSMHLTGARRSDAKKPGISRFCLGFA